MRDLERNKQKIYFSTYGSYSGTDEWGNVVDGYGSPLEYKIQVTAGKSEEDTQVYGSNVNYERELFTSDIDCPIGDKTRLWINRDSSKSHNYIVVAEPMVGLDFLKYPIRKVNVSE